MRSGHLDNGHLSVMKFIITEIFTGSRGGYVFDPSQGVEVFDNYFSALRYLVKERRLCKQIKWSCEVEKVGSILEYGRQHLWTMTEQSYHGFTHYYLSRVNENGFH